MLSKTTAMRMTGVEANARVALVCQVEMNTTPSEIETRRIAVRIQSCSRRRSTASRDGVRKSRRPATRASRRIRSFTLSSVVTSAPSATIGRRGRLVEPGAEGDPVR
jgi:hypothetical protein